jgi:omega-hydroxy-beta-dihydromenaquinone-9 sulfotransferase
MGSGPRQKTGTSGGYKDRPWIPRFWDGMTIGVWLRLAARNGFRIAPRRWGMALIATFCSQFNYLFWLVQMMILGRRIDRTKLAGDPIFVIGHWRSGTTLLHELLVLDSRFTFPDTYACFAPNHFLISGWACRRLFRHLLPGRRPMDNMAAGWDRPQEDEFALGNMGVPTPYRTIAFPNHPPQDQEFFSLDHVSPEARTHWKRRLLWFLKCVTLQRPQRLVLKSPGHTFRIKVLLEMFPNARFVHIVRNPYVLFPSTVNLWKRLYTDEGLQTPRFAGLNEYVLDTFAEMYDVFARDEHLIPPGHLCEVRYEDLISDPIGEMRLVYQQLSLGDFDRVLPALKGYFAERADYKTNRYDLDPQLEAEINRRWRYYLERYGYVAEPQQLRQPAMRNAG